MRPVSLSVAHQGLLIAVFALALVTLISAYYLSMSFTRNRHVESSKTVSSTEVCDDGSSDGPTNAAGGPDQGAINDPHFFISRKRYIPFSPFHRLLVRRSILPYGGCFRDERTHQWLDWARPRQSLRYPPKCFPGSERDEEVRQWIFAEERDKSRLFSYWIDRKRELALQDAIPLLSPIHKVLRLFHDPLFMDEKAFFRKSSTDEVKRALSETLFSHPLRNVFLHSWTEPKPQWPDGPFLQHLPDLPAQERINQLCAQLEGNVSNSDAKQALEASVNGTIAALAYQIVLLRTLDMVDSPNCANRSLSDLLAMTKFTGKEGKGIKEAHVFDFALRLHRSSEHPSSGLAVVSELVEWTKRERDPIAHVMLARTFAKDIKHSWPGHEDCNRAAFHLLEAYRSVEPFIYEDSRGVFERHQRLSVWRETGLDYEAGGSVGVESNQQYDEELDHLLRPAALADDPYAALRLGDFYIRGAPHLHIPPDFERAARAYKWGLQGGLGLAATRLGYMIVNGEIQPTNDTEAYDYFLRGLELGEPVGAMALAKFFHLSDRHMPPGVVRNKTEALRLLQFAGAHGLNEAYYQAGLLYFFDEALTNHTLAEDMFRKAYSTGHVKAAVELGKLYLFHYDNKATCESSLELLKQGLRADWTRLLAFDSEQALKRWFINPTGALMTYRIAHIALWQAEAELNAAFILESGRVRKKQPEQPKFARFVPSPWERVVVHLCESFNIPIPVEIRHDALEEVKQARQLYEQAVHDVKSAEALRRLGDCFTTPWRGVCDLDEPRGLALYVKSSELGDAEATWNVGYAYEHGFGGVERNVTRALVEYAKVQQSPRGFFPGIISRYWLLMRHGLRLV